MASGKAVVDLFVRAYASKLQFPNLKFKLDPPIGPLGMIKLYPATGKWKGSIIVNDGRAYPNATLLAIISATGKIEWRTTITAVKQVIEQICDNPVDFASVNGKRFNICCFCGRELTDPRSVHYGYGPICASKWDLPWEVMDVSKEDIELDIPHTEDVIKTEQAAKLYDELPSRQVTKAPECEYVEECSTSPWGQYSVEQLEQMKKDIQQEIDWKRATHQEAMNLVAYDKQLRQAANKPAIQKQQGKTWNEVIQEMQQRDQNLLDKKLTPDVEPKVNVLQIPILKK